MIKPVSGWKSDCFLSTIGDRVWDDQDGMADQDVGEPGLNGVTVELYGGLCPPEPGGVWAMQVTSGDGGYDFTQLPNGDYCVSVDDGTVPVDYVIRQSPSPGSDIESGQVVTLEVSRGP